MMEIVLKFFQDWDMEIMKFQKYVIYPSVQLELRDLEEKKLNEVKMKKKKIDADRQAVLMLGYLCISTEIESSLTRKVEILDRFGIEDSEIAIICGSSVQVVRNARYAKNKK